MCDLPKLSAKQQNYVDARARGLDLISAYRSAYNTSASDKVCRNEAYKLEKHPKIKQWLDFVLQNKKEVFAEKIKYETEDCYRELDEIRERALNERWGKYSEADLAVALKATETKGKLCGLFQPENNLSQSIVVQMDNVKIDGQDLDFDIGEDVTTPEDT